MSYTSELQKLNAKIDQLISLVEAPSRRISTTDVFGKVVTFQEDRVMQLYETSHPISATQYIDATIVFMNYQTNGRIVSFVLPGKPAVVATKLNIAVETLPLPVPEVQNVAIRYRTIDLLGKTPADFPGNKLNIPAPGGTVPTILVIKNWSGIGHDRVFWSLAFDVDDNAVAVEGHGSGFQVIGAPGYVGIMMDGDATPVLRPTQTA